MKTGSYSRDIVVKVNPEIAFQALTQDIGKWWGEVDRGVSQKHDEFSVFFESDQTRWKFRVIDISPNSSIDMECVEADHNFIDSSGNAREEWLETTLQWRLEPIEQGTKISLIHDGLVKDLECYEICVSGWDHFFVGSLQKYLNKGVNIG